MISRALCLTAFLASPALAGDVCHDIDARQGWQAADFPAGLVQGVHATGFWSVAPDLVPAGTNGHGGMDGKMLETRAEARQLVSARYGALLVRFDVQGAAQTMDWARFHSAIDMAGTFNMNLDVIEFRINEGNADLTDNSGALSVCFRYPN
ncbi:hypothetical protein [Antarctobacter jejuensis]|uniref:hypothetical protein n=1 Tax=Antarctobacter jejuensis TaxID=1439938 RepID=UPI003FCF8BCD